MALVSPTNSILYAPNTAGNISQYSINSSYQGHTTIDADKLTLSGDLLIGGESLVRWMNTINTVLGIPKRETSLEKDYPILTDLWNDAIKQLHDTISENDIFNTYQLNVEKYRNWDTLKK